MLVATRTSRETDDVQQAVRDERDAEGDDDETEEQDGNVQADSLPDRLPSQPDHERNEDGGQHPGEFHHQFRGHREEVLLGGPAGDHDGQGEDDDGCDQCRLETVVRKALILEEGDFPGEEGDQRNGQDGRNEHVEQQEHRERGHHGPAPLAGHVPERAGAVLVLGVAGRLLPITGEVLEEGPVRRLALDEDAVLDGLVPLLGVIVARFQERGGFRVVRTVAHQLLLLHPAGFQQALRIEDTAVTVDLAEGIQHEGAGPAGRVHGPPHGPFPANLAERIPPMSVRVPVQVHQLAGAVAIGHELGRRQALEGRDQAVVPVDVDVQPGDDVVERQFLREKSSYWRDTSFKA